MFNDTNMCVYYYKFMYIWLYVYIFCFSLVVNYICTRNQGNVCPISEIRYISFLQKHIEKEKANDFQKVNIYIKIL